MHSKPHSGEVLISVATRWVHFLFTYRIPVYILTFLLIVSPLHYSYSMAHPRFVLVALCFTSLMAFIYLLNKVTDKVEDAINLRGGPIGEKAARPTLVVSTICLWLPVLYLVFVPEFLPLYALVAMLGYYYSRPLPFLKKKFRLKQVLFVKNTISALIWALPPVGIQLIELGKLPNDPILLRNFLVLFCVFFAFESLWDIRDIEGDKVAQVHTIAGAFGVSVVKVIASTLLIIGYLLNYQILSLCMGLSFLVSLMFFLGASSQRGAWFYNGLFLLWIASLASLYFS